MYRGVPMRLSRGTDPHLSAKVSRSAGVEPRTAFLTDQICGTLERLQANPEGAYVPTFESSSVLCCVRPMRRLSSRRSWLALPA